MAKWPLSPQLKHDGSSLATACPGARVAIIGAEERARIMSEMKEIVGKICT